MQWRYQEIPTFIYKIESKDCFDIAFTLVLDMKQYQKISTFIYKVESEDCSLILVDKSLLSLQSAGCVSE